MKKQDAHMMTTASFKNLNFLLNKLQDFGHQILSNFQSKGYLKLQKSVVKLITVEKIN